jgi:Family of unknown function (DUF5989)
MSFVREFVRFVLARKKWWMIPIFLMMLLIGALVVATKGSVIAPFIYTLF